MNHILFDGSTHDTLLPLTRTRPVAGVRIGILTILEKWERFLNSACSCLTAPYLQEKYSFDPADDNILINAALLPERKLVEKIQQLKPGQALTSKGTLLALRLDRSESIRFAEGDMSLTGENGSPEEGILARIPERSEEHTSELQS